MPTSAGDDELEVLLGADDEDKLALDGKELDDTSGAFELGVEELSADEFELGACELVLDSFANELLDGVMGDDDDESLSALELGALELCSGAELCSLWPEELLLDGVGVPPPLLLLLEDGCSCEELELCCSLEELELCVGCALLELL